MAEIPEEKRADVRRAVAELRETLAEIDRVLHKMPRPPGREDWVYRDVPWLRGDFWNELLDAIGTENYQALAWSEREGEDGTRFKRGQFFVSPTGLLNLAAYAKTRRKKDDQDS